MILIMRDHNGFQSYEIFQRFGKYFEYKTWGSAMFLTLET
jgi:hypothetical protein